MLTQLVPGAFYTGLTRDDVAGLRYLIRSGHVHWEDVPQDSLVYVTNNFPTALTNLVTTNLALLVEQSLTNSDAGLVALYPDLVIVPGSTIPRFTNVVTATVSSYLTNLPWAPVGTPPQQAFATNYTTNVMFVYSRQFANVVTQSYSAFSFVTVIDTTLSFAPYAPVGSPPVTNTTTRTMLTNIPSGDFYILPANLCGVQILSNVLSTVIGVTNSFTATNTLSTSTNTTTNSFSGTFLLASTNITWFTNHTIAYFPVICTTNEPSLRRGIEKVTFVKTAYDSLLGRFYTPQTNYFSMTMITNSTDFVQKYQRVVTAPDFLFTARDMAPGPAADPTLFPDVTRNINFSTNNALPGLAGPGLIQSAVTVTFNKSGPLYYNTVTTNFQYFLDELTAAKLMMWGSYDGTTNAPVVYPNGTSIAAIESQMLMQVTSVSLPPAQKGVAYSTQLTGVGGKPPYTWTLAPGSVAVPSGLALTLDGRLSGTPNVSGVSYFWVQMTGTDDGFTVWQVALTVLPP
jgi:hypothetical protein